MDLRINNINFNGKKEIIYGFRKAANISRQIELYKNASVSPSKNAEINELLATRYAYTDMYIHDSEFINTANGSLTEKEINTLRQTLKPETNEHGTVEPFKSMYDNAIYVSGKERTSTEVKKAIEKLFSLLK